jgi:L-galactose dehydrogenase
MSSLPPTFVAGFHDEAAVRKMPYRQMGSRLVSQLTFGVSAIGGCYGNAGGQAEATELVHEAVRRGINLIDAAPWYGHGKAESVLGIALKGIPREAYYLTTKCVPARAPPNPPTPSSLFTPHPTPLAPCTTQVRPLQPRPP